MWVSGVGRLRSGTLVCYGEPSLTSGISHRQCGRTLGPVSDSRPRVCPERAPALSTGDRGPCWQPCPRAGLLGRSPCVPVHVCAHVCTTCISVFQACVHVHSCTHERGHNWVRVHTHTSVFPGVYARTLVLMEGSDAPGGTERDHRQTLPAPGRSANGALGACGQEPRLSKAPQRHTALGAGDDVTLT